MKMWKTKSIISVFLEKGRCADGETQAFPLCSDFFSIEGGDTQDISYLFSSYILNTEYSE